MQLKLHRDSEKRTLNTGLHSATGCCSVLNLGNRFMPWPLYAPQEERAIGSNVQEAVTIPKAIWMLWSKVKHLAQVQNQTPAIQPVAYHYYTNYAITTTEMLKLINLIEMKSYKSYKNCVVTII